ncbi:MAG: alpha/beta fold hydrolase [Pseudomonadales bacterium]|nr:alpha/beta fold hydrolase [Pseudomonadales bacterium]
MPQIDRDGVVIHYEVEGNGPTVLLTHGFCASGRMWARQRAALSDRYRVVSWDLRGHGASDSPDDADAYSDALSIGDMAAILEATTDSPAVIAGHSLGGFLSLALCLTHPERVRALGLFSTGPGYRKEAARAQWNAYAEKQALRYETRGLDAVPRGPMTAQAGHRSARGLALAARGILAQRDARVIDGLRSIQVPTLLLIGSEDARYFDGTDYIAAKVANVVSERVPGAGHALNLDAPDAFDEMLGRFLDALPGT